MNRTLQPFEFYYAVKILVIDALENIKLNSQRFSNNQQHPREWKILTLGTRRQIGKTYVATRLLEDFPNSIIVVPQRRDIGNVCRPSQPSTTKYRTVDPTSVYVSRDLKYQLQGLGPFNLGILDMAFSMIHRSVPEYIRSVDALVNKCDLVVEFS